MGAPVAIFGSDFGVVSQDGKLVGDVGKPKPAFRYLSTVDE